MGCESCSKGNGLPKGCKNNGSCGMNGCEKLHVFDWLSNMSLPHQQKRFNVVEVRFKNTRKEFFKTSADVDVNVGDVVKVDAKSGFDIGVVSTTGEMVKLLLNKKDIGFDSQEIKRIQEKAAQEEVDAWVEARQKEQSIMIEARKIATKLGLSMKISDVEFQGDQSKIMVYYTAEQRVDFREFIKGFSDKFKIRIEMKQIGVRQEAGRLGGIGSCGRELCCSTWLTDFRPVSTGAARYQQLSFNPQKLAGQCGKLKCCLNYELDMYLEVIKDFPKHNVKLKTKKGNATHFKTDIFSRKLWYFYEEENGGVPIELPLKRVQEIIELNKKNIFPEKLHEFEKSITPISGRKLDFSNFSEETSLTRFDKKNKNQRKKKRKKKPNKFNKDGK